MTEAEAPLTIDRDPEYGWTAREWRNWSLKISALLPEGWGGDEDELSIIERFVRNAAEGVVISPEEAALAAYGLRHVGDGTAWRKPEHLALAARLEAGS